MTNPILRIVWVVEAKRPKEDWRPLQSYVDDIGQGYDQAEKMLVELLQDGDQPGELYRLARYDVAEVVK